jgi:fructokinase
MGDAGPLLAGIELGGTKCVCLVGSGPADVRAQVSLPTGTNAVATLDRIEAELDRIVCAHGPIAALGIASFGPLDLAPGSPGYGSIAATPKPGWARTQLVSRFAPRFEVPIGFDTDVNGAALAEARWGAARGIGDVAYVTVGTGVGVGLVVGGRVVHGLLHPELGHVRISRYPGDDWPGACRFHGDCVEGLASGPAIAARAGMAADRIPIQSPVWDTVVHALSQLLHTLVLATSPCRILMGGGVMQLRPELFEPIRHRLRESLNGYVEREELRGGLADYVAPPELGARAGPLGALALAADALDAARNGLAVLERE